VNGLVFAGALVTGGVLIFVPASIDLFPVFVGLALLFGVLLVIPLEAPTCRP